MWVLGRLQVSLFHVSVQIFRAAWAGKSRLAAAPTSQRLCGPGEYKDACNPLCAARRANIRKYCTGGDAGAGFAGAGNEPVGGPRAVRGGAAHFPKGRPAREPDHRGACVHLYMCIIIYVKYSKNTKVYYHLEIYRNGILKLC